MRTLLLLTAACGLAAGAFRRFEDELGSVNGVIAATLLAMIGLVVGRIVAGHRAPRWILGGCCLAFAIGLVNGWIEDFGDEMVLWSFFSMSCGVLLGALYGPMGEGFEPPQEKESA